MPKRLISPLAFIYRITTPSITLINPAHEEYAAHPSPPLWMVYLQGILKPYPSTTLYEMVEAGGEFLEKDWSKFGSYMGKATYTFGTLDPQIVEKMYAKAYRDLYTPLYIAQKLWHNPKLFKAGLKYAFERMKRIFQNPLQIAG